jgi:hypothetical protein
MFGERVKGFVAHLGQSGESGTAPARHGAVVVRKVKIERLVPDWMAGVRK